jgi:hypothetical protein
VTSLRINPTTCSGYMAYTQGDCKKNRAIILAGLAAEWLALGINPSNHIDAFYAEFTQSPKYATDRQNFDSVPNSDPFDKSLEASVVLLRSGEPWSNKVVPQLLSSSYHSREVTTKELHALFGMRIRDAQGRRVSSSRLEKVGLSRTYSKFEFEVPA